MIFQSLFIVFTFFYLLRTVRNIFYQLFLWQLKEYRWDRMYIHLKTYQGKKLVFGKISLIKWFAIFLWPFFESVGIYYFYYPYFPILIFFIYFTEGTLYLLEARSGFKMPKFTPKTLGVITLTVLILIFSYFNFITFSPFGLTLLLLDKILPLIIASFILIFSVPSLIYKKIIYMRAGLKRKSLPELKVIGITGSFGKTSTKEFLFTLLSSKYKVVKTNDFINTEIGVAKSLLSDVSSKTEFYIAEMAAYKKGEIKLISKIVAPDIGVVTAINEQHLELFGSIENTMKAKYELIESLKNNGIAIFNGNNKYCLTMEKWAKEKGLTTIIYGTNPQTARDLIAYDIKTYPDKLTFKVKKGKEVEAFDVQVLGFHNIENLLAAIALSTIENMKLREISMVAKKIRPFKKTMEPIEGINKSLFINDTFNVNPESVSAAISYLQQFKRKKILILQPMIELGDKTDKLHEKVIEEAVRVCDYIFLTNLNYHVAIMNGARKVEKGEKKVKSGTSEEIVMLLEGLLDPGDVVIFEGKETEKIMKRLLSKNKK